MNRIIYFYFLMLLIKNLPVAARRRSCLLPDFVCSKGAVKNQNQQLQRSVTYYSILCGGNIGQIQSKGRSNRAGKAWALLVLVNIDSKDHAPV